MCFSYQRPRIGSVTSPDIKKRNQETIDGKRLLIETLENQLKKQKVQNKLKKQKSAVQKSDFRSSAVQKSAS